MNDLVEKFSKLRTTVAGVQGTGEAFSVHRLDARPDILLAKDQADNPAILITLTDELIRTKLRFNLNHISIDHDVLCRISEPQGTSQETFSIIRCRNADTELKEYFLRVISILIDSLELYPSYHVIEQTVSNLLELFAKIHMAPLKSIQGLWAELLVIAESLDPISLLGAWRSQVTNRHDFGIANERLEVKSTSGRVRHHSFGLQQLEAISDDQIVIASMFVEEYEGGHSVIDLGTEISQSVSHSAELKWKLESNMAEILGSGWNDASTRLFDRKLAVESIRYYWANDIPRPLLPESGCVHQVRFVSDLSQLERIGQEVLKGTGGVLFSNLG